MNERMRLGVDGLIERNQKGHGLDVEMGREMPGLREAGLVMELSWILRVKEWGLGLRSPLVRMRPMGNWKWKCSG